MTAKLNVVKLDVVGIGSKIKEDQGIYEEYYEIHLKSDKYIYRTIHYLKKIEDNCYDKKLIKYIGKLKYNYNQIISWRTDTKKELEDLVEILSFWYRDSLDQCKKIVKRLSKNFNYRETLGKVSDYLKKLKILINSPRYTFIQI